MRFGSLLLTLLAVPSACGAGPYPPIAAAAADLRTLEPSERGHQRYLTDFNLPEKERGNFELMQREVMNGLSAEVDFENPRIVAPEVYRVDIRWYGWKAATWEKLLKAPEPYYHATVRFKNRGGKVTRKTVVSAGPVRADVEYLMQATGSEIPIVRADWFFSQVSVAEQRSAGYYEWFGFASRNDFEKLTGLDIKEAKRLKKEVAAIIPDSGVAQNNRQVFRFGAVDAGYWRTLDVFDSETGRRNAIQSLDADFEHNAEEHIGFLPNGLLAFYLSDAGGQQQTTAPDRVGPDTTSTNNDKRIHAKLSCIRCHREGLRPIEDYARKLFQPPVALAVTDYDDFLRKKRLYLGELQRHLFRDRSEYEYNLRKLTGWTPTFLASAYRDAWEEYYRPVTIQKAAVEWGTTPARIRTAFAAKGLPPPLGSGGLPPVLAAYVHEPPHAIRREHFEEFFQEGMALLQQGDRP